MLHQHAHRIDIESQGRTPEWRCALVMHTRLAAEYGERVLRIPQVRIEANIRIGTGIEQRFQEVEMRCLLLLVFNRVCV